MNAWENVREIATFKELYYITYCCSHTIISFPFLLQYIDRHDVPTSLLSGFGRHWFLLVLACAPYLVSEIFSIFQGQTSCLLLSSALTTVVISYCQLQQIIFVYICIYTVSVIADIILNNILIIMNCDSHNETHFLVLAISHLAHLAFIHVEEYLNPSLTEAAPFFSPLFLLLWNKVYRFQLVWRSECKGAFCKFMNFRFSYRVKVQRCC